MTRKGSPKKVRLIEELKKNPDRSRQELAAAAGCSVAYIYLVAKEQDVCIGKNYRNRQWIKRECARQNITRAQLFDLLVTDARLEDEEKSNDPT